MPDPNLTLRVDSIELTGDFQRMSPTAPLPWSLDPSYPWHILDANQQILADVHAKTKDDAIRTAGMIVCAANTCGGIKMKES